MVLVFYRLHAAYAGNGNSERVNTIRRLFLFFLVELRALLISRPPFHVHKVRSCKVEILICVENTRKIRQANISQKLIR